MSFLDLLKPPGEKVTLGELALLKSKLPERVTGSVPMCIYTDVGGYDYEVFILHAWIIARRENPDITVDEVGNLIGLKESEACDQIEREILFFFTTQLREEVDDHFKRVAEAVEKAAAAREDGASPEEVEKIVNPPEKTEEISVQS